MWEEIEEPTPGPGEAAIEVHACGIGLTVLNCINGDLDDDAALLPRVPGHELTGRVTAVGPGAADSLVGRMVAAYFYLSCGSCGQCRAGHDSRCTELGGWVGVHTDGGYAPVTTLPARNLIPLPDGLDPIAATVVPDAVATPVHVRSRAKIGASDRVAVIGAGGGVGIHMIQVAAHAGAEVAGLDILDEKLEAIARLGARPVQSDRLTALDPDTLFPMGRPTVVVDLVGVAGTARWALDALDPGGRLVTLTTFRDNPFEIESRELVFGETAVIGSRYATKAEVAEAARLVASGAVTPIIGATTGPDGVLEMHAALRRGTLTGRGALAWSRR